MQAPVHILFACAIAGRDVLWVVYDVPSVSICRGSQRVKAAENLGLPKTWLSDIEALGGHIPECNALRAAPARAAAKGGGSGGAGRRRGSSLSAAPSAQRDASYDAGNETTPTEGAGDSPAIGADVDVDAELPGQASIYGGDGGGPRSGGNNGCAPHGGQQHAGSGKREDDPTWQPSNGGGGGGGGVGAVGRPEREGAPQLETGLSMRLGSLLSSLGSGLLSDHGTYLLSVPSRTRQMKS